jgi:peptide/nickel transport system ATP-binding protein
MILSVDDLRVRYAHRDGMLRAVDGVSLTVNGGETIGLVGESGCGKSTLGKALLRLVPSSGGRILFDGIDLTAVPETGLKPIRRRLQMVFQDPFASLNPRQTIFQSLDAPLAVHGHRNACERRRQIEAMIERVGLSPTALSRFPHEFSGGQRQRIVIARALILKPEFVVCDEPVSALDVSVQAQILNLLADLKSEYNLSYLFISHDLSVIRYIADRVLVMHLGQIVESAGQESLFSRPLHPYTRALIAAAPAPGPRQPRIQATVSGELPSASKPPPGCRFHPRCPIAIERCRMETPPLRTITRTHAAACHLA